MKKQMSFNIIAAFILIVISVSASASPSSYDRPTSVDRQAASYAKPADAQDSSLNLQEVAQQPRSIPGIEAATLQNNYQPVTVAENLTALNQSTNLSTDASSLSGLTFPSNPSGDVALSAKQSFPAVNGQPAYTLQEATIPKSGIINQVASFFGRGEERVVSERLYEYQNPAPGQPNAMSERLDPNTGQVIEQFLFWNNPAPGQPSIQGAKVENGNIVLACLSYENTSPHSLVFVQFNGNFALDTDFLNGSPKTDAGYMKTEMYGDLDNNTFIRTTYDKNGTALASTSEIHLEKIMVENDETAAQ